MVVDVFWCMVSHQHFLEHEGETQVGFDTLARKRSLKNPWGVFLKESINDQKTAKINLIHQKREHFRISGH